MSEEIVVPPMDESKREAMRAAIRSKWNNKGKDPAKEPPVSGPSNEVIQRLAAHASRNIVSNQEPKTVEQEAATPCVWVAGAAVAVLAIAFYFGRKYWKSYGITPEELAE